MKLFKYACSFLCIVIGFNAFANTTWTGKAVRVELGTEIQSRIDDVIVEIFKSPVGLSLCGLFQNPTAIYLSLGVSSETAISISKDCPKTDVGLPKILHKKYYLSFEKNMGLDSWTDFGNNTYIFVDDELSYQRLKEILLHEIAIGMDAKARLMFTGYQELAYLSQLIRKNPNARGTYHINIGVQNEYDKTLQSAFNFAAWGPLSRAFATIRAFEFEARALGQTFKLGNNEQCGRVVRSLLPVMKSLPTPPKTTGTEDVDLVLDVVEKFDESFDQNLAPKSARHEQEILNFLLSDRLKLKDFNGQSITFCQFMTQSVLVNRSVYSMLGAGPRPRLTGGSGGQGRDNELRVIPEIFNSKTHHQKSTIEISKDQKLNDIIKKIKIENSSIFLSPNSSNQVKPQNQRE